jgi:hypothetical protein
MDEFAKRCYRRDRFLQTGTPRKAFASTLAVCLYLGVLLVGSRSPKTSAGPPIEFTKIPVSTAGGLDKMDTIAGTVTGVCPEQRNVFYAQSGGRWWMQPFARDPLFSKIQGDSQWKNATHLGEEVALLLDPSDSPPHAIESPPAASGAVASVAVVKGQTADPSSPPLFR